MRTLGSFVSTLVVLLFSLSGCAGGLDCPIDPPSCCYDTLFGCGTFDLPDGCSCSQYRLMPASKSVSRSTTPGLSGLWSGSLQRNSSTCPSLQRQLRGTARVSEGKGLVTVVVPGYGKLRGRTQGKGYSASGRYSVPFSQCTAQLSTKFQSTGVGKGRANVSLTYACRSGYSCSASYSGNLKK